MPTNRRREDLEEGWRRFAARSHRFRRGCTSRVTSQLSSKRNPRYLCAIYGHLERNPRRAPLAPLVHDLDNVGKRLFMNPCSHPRWPRMNPGAEGPGTIRFPSFHGARQRSGAFIRSDVARNWTPSWPLTDSFRSTGIRHAFSTQSLIPGLQGLENNPGLLRPSPASSFDRDSKRRGSPRFFADNV